MHPHTASLVFPTEYCSILCSGRKKQRLLSKRIKRMEEADPTELDERALLKELESQKVSYLLALTASTHSLTRPLLVRF